MTDLTTETSGQGLYSSEFEHDACGVGLIANIKGQKTHDTVEKGLRILENMVHRGAESADNKTGDGAGILTQIPHEFILLQGIPVPEKGTYGTGLVFMPKDGKEADICMDMIKSAIAQEGLELLAVRNVPVNSEILGEISRLNEPDIKQIFVTGESDTEALELKLYIIRKKIEKAGIFILVSKRSIAPSKVLEIYYTRQEIEQVFDLGKNYAGMLPLSVQTEETFRGHMVLTFIATIVAKLLSDRLKQTKYPIQPTLANLATQSCSEIKGCLITSEPNKVTRLAYKAVGVEYPVCIE